MIVARPRAADTILATATCTVAEQAGDLVYIAGPRIGADYDVRRADITAFGKMPAVAVILYKVGATRAIIQFQGEVGLYTGLTPGRVYWVGDSGQPVLAPPTVTTGERKYWQPVGVATDSDRLYLRFYKDLKTRVG